MMELADVLDSKSSGSDTVRVRPPLPAPKKGTHSVPFFVFGAHLIFLQSSHSFSKGQWRAIAMLFEKMDQSNSVGVANALGNFFNGQ